MSRQKYVLKDESPEGVYQDIGRVLHGEVVTPYSDEHEAAIKKDNRFKQYRGPAPESDAPIAVAPVTEEAKVEEAEAPAKAKPAPKKKE